MAADARPPALILVVDDDPDILDALAEILEGEGYAVERAKHGREALQKVDARRPQLILLDLMMPVMDGYEFSQQLKTRNSAANIPIVVLSADRAVQAKASQIGARDFLAKPFELSDLLRIVGSMVPPPRPS
jgi:CheY-like chemotaxis protein